MNHKQALDAVEAIPQIRPEKDAGDYYSNKASKARAIRAILATTPDIEPDARRYLTSALDMADYVGD